MKYPKIEQWLKAMMAFPDANYDNITLYTGEEGVGKSRLMRLVARKLDPSLNIDRIHFGQDPYLDQAATLDHASAILLDEFKGHRRAAMHGHRLDFLEFLKECRGLRLHQKIGFPHVTQVDRDIMRSRVRFWVHLPARGQIVVRERASDVRTKFVEAGEEPVQLVRFPVVGRYTYSDRPDPLESAYDAKKEANMRRNRTIPGVARQEGPRLNWAGANPFLDLVQAELKRSP